MVVEILYSEGFKRHDPSPYEHPESPARLDTALEGIRRYLGTPGVYSVREPGRSGDMHVWAEVHSPSYVKMVLGYAGTGTVDWIDGDTYVSPGTMDALRELTSAVLEAVNLAEHGGSVFILGRPPGHHAGVMGRAMGAPTAGFCLFNASALVARKLSSLGSVAVVDFDVHHGNGTQEIFFDDPSVIHIDVHQDPRTLYPGTGYPEDVGAGRARGTKINVVVPPGSGDDIYLDALELIADLLAEHSPDYLVFSAGFDAYEGDNLFSHERATSRFYSAMGKLVWRVKPKGVVAVLEGGYGSGLYKGLPAFTAGLAGMDDPVGDEATESFEARWNEYREWRDRLIKALSKYWRSLRA